MVGELRSVWLAREPALPLVRLVLLIRAVVYRVGAVIRVVEGRTVLAELPILVWLTRTALFLTLVVRVGGRIARWVDRTGVLVWVLRVGGRIARWVDRTGVLVWVLRVGGRTALVCGRTALRVGGRTARVVDRTGVLRTLRVGGRRT